MKKISINKILVILIIILILNMLFSSYSKAFDGIDDFISAGKDNSNIDETALQTSSKKISKMFLAVGNVAAVAYGIVIAIKLMMDSATDRADVKKALVPYVAGVVILYGAYGIWSVAINVGQGIFEGTGGTGVSKPSVEKIKKEETLLERAKRMSKEELKGLRDDELKYIATSEEYDVLNSVIDKVYPKGGLQVGKAMNVEEAVKTLDKKQQDIYYACKEKGLLNEGGLNFKDPNY